MRQVLCSSAFVLAVAGLSFAGLPIATVSSTGPIVIGATELSANSVSAWPLIGGDEIRTTGSPAVLIFRDGSRVTLDRTSRVKLTGTGERATLSVLGGSVDYQFATGSQVTLSAGSRSVGAESGLRGKLSDSGRVGTATPSHGRFAGDTRQLFVTLKPSNSY